MTYVVLLYTLYIDVQTYSMDLTKGRITLMYFTLDLSFSIFTNTILYECADYEAYHPKTMMTQWNFEFGFSAQRSTSLKKSNR